MTDLNQRAGLAVQEALCRIRYLSRQDLNEEGKNHLFRLADAAHNIPVALTGDKYHEQHLERDVQALEGLMQESFGQAACRYRSDQRNVAQLGAVATRLIQAASVCLVAAVGVGGLGFVLENPDFMLTATWLMGAEAAIVFSSPLVLLFTLRFFDKGRIKPKLNRVQSPVECTKRPDNIGPII